MYVCICNGLNERRIRQAVDNGARTAREVYRALGCEPQCGQCAMEIQTILHKGRSLHQSTVVALQAPLPS
jgi:bacterioferritin-associated ferredoxin